MAPTLIRPLAPPAALLALCLAAPAPGLAAEPDPEPTPTHEATDFRLTLTRGGEDLFALRARRSLSYGGTRTELEDVELVAGSGPAPGLILRARRGTYLPASGDFALAGQVEVISPGGLTARLDRLDYRAGSGLAESDDAVELSDAGMQGSARGLEVAPREQRLSLRSEVRLHYVESDRTPRRLDVDCGALDYFSHPPRARCREGVRVTSGDRLLQARALELQLREADRRPLSGRATGEASLSLRLDPAPDASEFRGFDSGSALALAGERVDLDFSPETGALKNVRAPEGGEITMRPLAGPEARRSLRAARVELRLAQARRGSRILPESLAAAGDVRLDWEGPEGAGRLTAGELEAHWGADAERIESARLRGGFRLEQPDLIGTGAEADLEGDWFELRGEAAAPARLEREGRLLGGARLRLPRGEGAWSGDGGVQARHRGSAAGGGWSPLGGEGEFWISAERFEVTPGAWSWLFQGHARAWQGSNLIEAQSLRLDESERTLAARGEVVTRAVGAGGGDAEPPGKEGAGLVWVRAPRLDYSEATRCAEYRDGVELIHDTSHLAARELDAWLTGEQGRVERILVRGEVKVVYADALGEAERGEYSPQGRRLRLWTPGGLAHAQRRDGSQALSGMELTFEGSSDRIAVRSGARGRSWVVFEERP
jgi:hypothetical protein